MLVISRKVEESFMVGQATIKIVGTVGKRVLVGIDAPPDVKVLRSELVASANEWLRPVECDDSDQT